MSSDILAGAEARVHVFPVPTRVSQIYNHIPSYGSDPLFLGGYSNSGKSGHSSWNLFIF